MDQKTIKRAVVLAVISLLAATAVVFADTIPADGDSVEPGNQNLIELGTRAPGEVVTWDVGFSLTCAGLSHAAPGQTITIQLSSVQVPLNATATATSTTIGPVPATWTAGGAGCPSPAPTLPSNGLSHVTLRMPTTPGASYIFTVMYARIGGSGLSGLTAISFQADVVANTPPVLSLPGPISAEGNTLGGATVAYQAFALDDQDDPDPIPTCAPGSGSVFPVGTTTVACSATDSGGLTGTGSFTVTVGDTTGPVLVLPSDQGAEATSSAGAVVTFSTSASDIVDGPVSVTCDHNSGDTFPLGTTTVACSAGDVHGNSSFGSFHVTVVDTTDPVLVLPANVSTEATSSAGAAVSFTTSANDIVDGTVGVICDHNSGDTFPLGTTVVACSATDGSGNTGSGSFTVTVVDNTDPVLVLPADISAEATSSAGASVSFTTSANDVVDGAITVSCDHSSGDAFPLGTTTVACSATDTSGNTSEGSFNVTVRDTTDPTLVDMPNDQSVTTSNPAGAKLAYTLPSATDLVDPSPDVWCAPAAGSLAPLGTTTVTCTARDDAGNTDSASFQVTVSLVSSVQYSVVWGEPIGGSSPTLVANQGRNVPLKLEIFANGIELTAGSAEVRIVACGGGDPLSVPLTFASGRWNGHLDTSSLRPGCYVGTVLINGAEAGSFDLNLTGADPAKGANPAKDKPPKT